MKKFRKKIIIAGISSFIIGYTSLFLYSLQVNREAENELLIHDVSRIMPVHVQEIVQSEQEQGLVDAIMKAKKENLKISIAGARHSQGGHIFYEDALLLDMTSFNQILSLDVENKRIRVQSGATWEQIQDYINPYGLSIKVMQSSNIFTVGGSLSANAHGRDVRYGPLLRQ
nr:FAD-dependent oxidoreductase [Caldalkalibacillus mannanilyticus]